ncbi:chitobiase/beta-hexosaminidase C-terminal domain-containing protein [Bacillus sp. SH5-2]|uniref:chitobiase/beta-hexosaminidase C-terminal domain-containing protein n=1 Tax=Bacillus sp. SH5-2 TaxID=2217834 RepID=UPI0011EDE4F0|nr:chitobiase/beta-hexosaminidase C-terminal domain-containing protein [Bacillus sp. SH5-2]KAA0766393.1 hypothetical protein DN410_02845 [Bacillus sp. SH5-2]
MAEFKKSLPIWNATGVEPPLSKAERGWKVDERPPADYMNYLQNRTYEAIKELQENAVHKETIGSIQSDINTAKQGVEENTNRIKILQEQITTGGSGVLSYNTLSELQSAFPNGSDKPVWIVSENSWYYWEGTSAPDTKPPNITASPNGGTFSSSQSVTLIADEAATIYYTLDGSTPTTGSAIYNAPITISTTKTLKFFGKDSAGNVSAVQTLLFTINTGGGDTTPPIVTANPVAGTYTSTQLVALSANETATIYYTLDGSTPTVNSAVYTSPISVANSLTLKYLGKDTAGNISSVQTAVYTINKETTPGTVLFEDTFNRPDSPTLGVSDSGHTWTNYTSVNGTVLLGIRNNMAYSSGGTYANALNKFRRFTTKIIPTNNFVIESQTRSLPSGSGDSMAICIRMASDDADMLYLLKPVLGLPTSKYSLVKIPKGGNASTIVTGTSFVGENDAIKIENYSDGLIKVFVNDVLELTATDTFAMLPTTTVGIGVNANIVGLGFDNFKVTAL